MQTLIGFDFSINKPAACILKNNDYKFISWPYGLSKPQKKIYSESPVSIIDRIDTKDKGNDVSEKMRYEVENSRYLGELITNTIKEYLCEDTLIAFEGLSYGSSGNVVVQLGGYKYILMDILSKYVPLRNMFTYSPITLKATAGCSKKGMGKSDMINVFATGKSDFSGFLNNNKEKFQTKSGNWITHLDDIVDSYWCVETLIIKQLI